MMACSCQYRRPVVTTGPARPDILKRDIAWIHDTIPVLRFETPEIYAVVRLNMERCSGLTRAGWPRLYLAPWNPLPYGRAAFYDPDAEAIVFALSSEANLFIVGHEILHWLLEPTVSPRRINDETPDEFAVRVHPPEYFDRRCGHLLRPQG